MARQGMAKQGMAKQGMAKQGMDAPSSGSTCVSPSEPDSTASTRARASRSESWWKLELGAGFKLLLSVSMLALGISGMVFAFAPTRAAAVEAPDAVLIEQSAPASAVPPDVAPKPQQTALFATSELSALATRIVVDRANAQVTISREIVFGIPADTASDSGRGADGSPDCELISDVACQRQLEFEERNYTVGDMQVRIVLEHFGPDEPAADVVKSAVRVVIWVNGVTRAMGFLESMAGQTSEDGPVFERISVIRRGGVIYCSGLRARGGVIERAEATGNLSTERRWIMSPDDCFEVAEASDREPVAAHATCSMASAPRHRALARR